MKFAEKMTDCVVKVSSDPVSDRAACRDGLGMDRHDAQLVQLDLCGGHIRSHLCAQVLEGVRKGERLKTRLT